MDATNIDPVDDLLGEIAIERQHLTRMSTVDVRDELAFRLYPLLARIVETLAERIDVAEGDVTDEAQVPREFAGRIVLLFGKLIDAVTKAAPEQAGPLTDEAKQIVGELVQIYAPDEAFDASPAQIPAESQPAVEEPHHE